MDKPRGNKQITASPPKPNSKQWIKNESIIAKSPQLRRMKDITNGFRPTSAVNTGVNDQAYKDGWERIFGNKDEKQ